MSSLKAHHYSPEVDTAAGPPIRDGDLTIPAGPVELKGNLTVPDTAKAVVLFANGIGRRSRRNRSIASTLNDAGFGTLVFDLLTDREADRRGSIYDIQLLGGRLAAVTGWLSARLGLPGSSVGYFGSGSGAAAALWAATIPGLEIDAVVTRGGRPDLARERLPEVTAPTLLIVGEYDETVLDLNRDAQRLLRGRSELTIVPGASHLFEEPGAIQTVSELARDWFVECLDGSAD